MPRKFTNTLKSKAAKKLQYPGTPATANSLYSGTQLAERDNQQQRYFTSGTSRPSIQSKHGGERTLPVASGNCDLAANYHPWRSEYHKIITREKNIKPMTKDPYTPTTRLVSHAVERITIETECCSALIPATDINIEKVNIQPAPRLSQPIIIRYVRRNELMPSEQSTLASTSMKTALLSQSQYIKPATPVMSTNKTTSIFPSSTTTNQLLTETSMRNNA